MLSKCIFIAEISVNRKHVNRVLSTTTCGNKIISFSKRRFQLRILAI